MSLPSIENAARLRAAMAAEQGHPLTIGCIKCHKPLWSITIKEKYGTKWASEKTPFPGVPPYSEFWAKDAKTALRTDCPHCGLNYFDAIVSQDGTIITPKIYVLEYKQ